MTPKKTTVNPTTAILNQFNLSSMDFPRGLREGAHRNIYVRDNYSAHTHVGGVQQVLKDIEGMNVDSVIVYAHEPSSMGYRDSNQLDPFLDALSLLRPHVKDVLIGTTSYSEGKPEMWAVLHDAYTQGVSRPPGERIVSWGEDLLKAKTADFAKQLRLEPTTEHDGFIVGNRLAHMYDFPVHTRTSHYGFRSESYTYRKPNIPGAQCQVALLKRYKKLFGYEGQFFIDHIDFDGIQIEAERLQSKPDDNTIKKRLLFCLGIEQTDLPTQLLLDFVNSDYFKNDAPKPTGQFRIRKGDRAYEIHKEPYSPELDLEGNIQTVIDKRMEGYCETYAKILDEKFNYTGKIFIDKIRSYWEYDHDDGYSSFVGYRSVYTLRDIKEQERIATTDKKPFFEKLVLAEAKQNIARGAHEQHIAELKSAADGTGGDYLSTIKQLSKQAEQSEKELDSATRSVRSVQNDLDRIDQATSKIENLEKKLIDDMKEAIERAGMDPNATNFLTRDGNMRRKHVDALHEIHQHIGNYTQNIVQERQLVSRKEY